MSRQYIPVGTNILLNVNEAYEDLVKKGFLTQLYGFKIMSSARVQGDNIEWLPRHRGNKNWLDVRGQGT